MTDPWAKTRKLTAKLQVALKLKSLSDDRKKRDANILKTISDDSKLWHLDPRPKMSFSKLTRSASVPDLSHEEVNMFYKMRLKQAGSVQLLAKQKKERILKPWKTVKSEVYTIVKAPHLFPNSVTIWNTLEVLEVILFILFIH